jgi:murein DD-endopeptidase MepM/ murein hydrolase activator NlpD
MIMKGLPSSRANGFAAFKIQLSLGAICFALMGAGMPAYGASADQTALPQSPALQDLPSFVQSLERLGKPIANFNLKQLNAERMELFQRVASVTGISWSMLAAIDQYEYTIHQFKKKGSSEPQELISIRFPEMSWAGMMNPDHGDKNLKSIRFFGGIGQDGSSDGLADENNSEDRLVTMTSIVLKRGIKSEDIRASLWEYYQNSRSVQRIEQFAKIYETTGTMELYERAFPLPYSDSISYRDTWGASRGWGGYRIHEGTDLFADYGTPVRSTCYGIVEVKGWNPYGGWRVGIRDVNNVYYYYAHLSKYQKGYEAGDIVKPGQVIGYVGSSGYGKPGTSGKFPPHLHFGMYRDSGLSDWSFDPYPYLRKWEQSDRNRKR